MRTILPLLRGLATLPMLVASVTLFALMVLTFCDVVMRSVFNNPIEAGTELTRMAIAIIVFSVLPVLSAQGGHIVVDLADGVFQRFSIARWRDAIVALGCGIMLYWPATRVVVLAERARDYGDQTEYLAIPTYIIAWFIAIMTFLTAAALIVRGLLHLFAPHVLETAP